MTMGRPVYSTEQGRLCPDCAAPVARCRCKVRARTPDAGDGVLRIRRERKGRGGKTVTVVSGFALPEAELKSLAKQLKQACGSGGTLTATGLEVQGDRVQQLLELLQARGFQVKLAGG
ncbi:MAG: translation initiation factor Sui1 [Spongiibacteraceae bacterium]|nr:translation initiation factor Sui1 [Spongiibacteraceae bacterium]